jgi:hypothetical protein
VYGIVDNLYNPAVCKRIGSTPLDFVRTSAEMCQPADVNLYVELAGERELAGFTANRPLFYFSSLKPNDDENLVKDQSHLTSQYGAHIERWALMQRNVWATHWDLFSMLRKGTGCKEADTLSEAQMKLYSALPAGPPPAPPSDNPRTPRR